MVVMLMPSFLVHRHSVCCCYSGSGCGEFGERSLKRVIQNRNIITSGALKVDDRGEAIGNIRFLFFIFLDVRMFMIVR